jgi:hypothetical protein
VSARTEQPDSLQREWWSRLPRILYSPTEVFVALRDDSREAGDARQEPLVAVSFLAGISMFLSLVAVEPPYDRYSSLSGLNLVLQSILGGAVVGLSNLWLGGALVYLGARGLGAVSGYRLARHIVGFATAPFVVSLILVWPLRLALYGQDLFRSTGKDEGSGGDAFRAIDALLLAWTLVLVLIAIRVVQRWSWGRSAAALGVAALFATLLGTLAYAASR